MSVAGATPQQLAQLADFVLLERAICVQMFQLFKSITALQAAWNANILGIIGAPQGTLIQDNTGYAGAVELTDTQVTNIFGTLQSVLTTNNTAGNQAAFVLATGPNNML
jgi:hypothetical protein